ncbi:hypothetical protein [Ensifer canadensis]
MVLAEDDQKTSPWGGGLLRLDAAQQDTAAAGNDAGRHPRLLLDDGLHGLDGRDRVGGVDYGIGGLGARGGKAGEKHGRCGKFHHGSSSWLV